MATHPRKRRRRKRSSLPLFALLFILVLLSVSLYRSNHVLQTTKFDPVFADLPSAFDGCKIVVLSDLHGAVFGDNHAKLLAAIKKQSPDLIAVVGDLIDEDTTSPLTYAAELAHGLQDIAPVYYVTGNHEWATGSVPELKERLSSAGWTVLSNQFLTLEKNGDVLVLAGIDDPNGFADQKTPETLASELYAEQGDPFWLLLAHRNDHFKNQYSLLGADLVLSGHGHGGIIRLPFTDGLLGTQHNFFPSYTAGLYEENGSVLFASRGLGNVGITFRLFNRPEVAVLTLHKG